MSRPKTPTTDQIRAWIDNSSFYDDLEQDPDQPVAYHVDKSDLLTELQDKIEELQEEAYDEGQTDAFEDVTPDNLPDLLKEEIGTTYTVDQFKDCRTLEDFQEAYKWIYSRSLNFSR